MRKITSLLGTLILIAHVSNASADPTTTVPTARSTTTLPKAQPRYCVAGPVLDASDCDKSSVSIIQTISQGSTGSSGPSVRYTSSDGKTYVPYNRLSTGPDGQPCATIGYVEAGKTPPDERLLVDPNPRETNIPIYGSDLRILETYPPCPEQPAAPGDPTPIETRAMVAARVWQHIPLPKPGPTIAPGRAITGKLAYLETKGEVSHTFRTETVFGTLELVAHGSYSVDWGDGEKSGPFLVEGLPWPDGTITHIYQRVGKYDVIVTENWTADWSLGDENGILPTLRTTGAIPQFPVEQIQAVITQ